MSQSGEKKTNAKMFFETLADEESEDPIYWQMNSGLAICDSAVVAQMLIADVLELHDPLTVSSG